MNLQTILFPKPGLCSEEELYFRKEAKIEYHSKEQYLEFKRKTIVWFDTYFNSFSIEKWKKYTKLDVVSLKLILKGSFKITLLSKEKLHNDIIEKVIGEYYFDSDEKEELSIDFNSFDYKGMYFFKLEALKGNSFFYGGEYYTQISEDKIQDVKLGIVICTFKREPFIYRNIQILKENILENKNSPLREALHVYISDNGKSLNIDKIDNEKIHVYPNKNVGGAGGFTRGLIEILNNKEVHGITHALVMDDDIIIEPQSLVKTYNFLRLIKEEYKDVFIGGAMLRIDNQSIQVEAGASWNAGALHSLKQGLDLRNVDAVLYNEIEEYTEFNAWWYCCFPTKVVTPENLPLPIFIRGDDLEYGLRNMKHLVLLNGICVWHEPFENKYTSFLEYYIVRNLLIDNALHFPSYSKMQFLKFLFKRVTRQAIYYRYKNIDLIYRAINDFYGGVDWIKNQDGEALHKEIMNSGFKPQLVEDLNMPFHYSVYEQSLDRFEKRTERIKRFLSMNGLLLKANRDNIVSMANATPANFYRAKRVLNYDITTKKGFITEKSYIHILRAYVGFFKIAMKTLTQFDKAKVDYRNRVNEITSLEFWNKYLGE